MDSDAELLKLIALGGKPGEGAATALVRKYRKPFLGDLLGRRVDPGTAEDLVQDAFVKVIKSAGSFRGDSSASSWIWTVLRHVHLDHVRKNRPEINLDDEGWEQVEAEMENDGSDGPERSLERRQLDDCLDQAFKRFAREHPAAAAALEKSVQYGWPIRDIATFLGRTEGATKEYLSQCRKKLIAVLKPCHDLWGPSA